MRFSLSSAAFLGCLMLGCASAAPNVRALRMFDREEPSSALLREHIRQMADTLALINLLINGTQYDPGAPWVSQLPLDDVKADRARSLIPDEAGKASFVWVYATHVNSVVEQARRLAATRVPALPPPPAVPAVVPPAPEAAPGSGPEAAPSASPADGLAPDGLLSDGLLPPAPPPAAVPDPPPAPLPAAPPLPPGSYASILDALAAVHPTLGGRSAELSQQLTQALADEKQRYDALAAAPTPDPSALAASQANQQKLTGELTQLNDALSRPLSAADLRDPKKAQIVRDAVTITSVALRLAVEAASLATVAGLEAAALSGQSGKNILKGAPDTLALVAELPDDARRIYGDLAQSADGLSKMVSELAALDGSQLLDTPGYDYKSGLVDDIVGLAWDSVHVEVQGGGEAFFYHAIADEEQSTSSDGDSYDYTGRQTRLEYDVEPIVLASARLSLKFDWAHWADAVGLKLGYATNRVYKSGGDIQTGSLANELGIKSKWSDALDAALAIAGVKAGVRIAHFANGTVRERLVADDSLLADAPLTFDMKQIDLGYDLSPRYGALIRNFTVGFRYFDYTLPRILYEFENATPGAENAEYVFTRETPPQRIRTQYYMVTLAARAEKRVTPHLTPYLTLDIAGGYGPTHYYFLKDQLGEDVEANHDEQSSSGIGGGFAGTLGFRWTLGGPESRLNAYLDAYYHVQFITSILDSKNDGDTIVNVGTTDVFHGPVAAFGASF